MYQKYSVLVYTFCLPSFVCMYVWQPDSSYYSVCMYTNSQTSYSSSPLQGLHLYPFYCDSRRVPQCHVPSYILPVIKFVQLRVFELCSFLTFSFFPLTQCLQMQFTVLLFHKIFYISAFERDYQDGFMQSHLYFISALCGDFSWSHNLVSLSHFLFIFQVLQPWCRWTLALVSGCWWW